MAPGTKALRDGFRFSTFLQYNRSGIFCIRSPKFCEAKLGRVETETPLSKRSFLTATVAERKKVMRSNLPL